MAADFDERRGERQDDAGMERDDGQDQPQPRGAEGGDDNRHRHIGDAAVGRSESEGRRFGQPSLQHRPSEQQGEAEDDETTCEIDARHPQDVQWAVAGERAKEECRKRDPDREIVDAARSGRVDQADADGRAAERDDGEYRQQQADHLHCRRLSAETVAPTGVIAVFA
jgi:hypothetical protein